MREIKFRGKRLDNGEFIYGLFCRHKIGNLIVPCIQKEIESDNGDYIEYIAIDGNTLGQYTGLKDKNGTGIYEGDIVSKKPFRKPFVVYFDINEGGFCCKAMDGKSDMEIGYSVACDVKIIGNIHENKELLK